MEDIVVGTFSLRIYQPDGPRPLGGWGATVFYHGGMSSSFRSLEIYDSTAESADE
jgi:hypothetical protein